MSRFAISAEVFESFVKMLNNRCRGVFFSKSMQFVSAPCLSSSFTRPKFNFVVDICREDPKAPPPIFGSAPLAKRSLAMFGLSSLTARESGDYLS